MVAVSVIRTAHPLACLTISTAAPAAGSKPAPTEARAQPTQVGDVRLTLLIEADAVIYQAKPGNDAPKNSLPARGQAKAPSSPPSKGKAPKSS